MQRSRAAGQKLRKAVLLALAMCFGIAISSGASPDIPVGPPVQNGDDSVYPSLMDKEREGSTPKLGLNVPYSEQYFEQIRKLHNGGDASAVNKLLKSQQLWRRAVVTPRGGGDSGNVPYALTDCTPTYILSRSWLDLLRTTVVKKYVCHSLCLNYPSCTSTTPLAYVQPAPQPAGSPADSQPQRRLGLLLQCGLRVFRAKGSNGLQKDQILDLQYNVTGAANSQPVCTNTLSRARNFEGGSLQYHATRNGASSSGKTTSLTLVSQPGAEVQEGLTVNLNDLWSNLEVQPLRLVGAEPGSQAVTRVLVPVKTDLDSYWTVGELAEALHKGTTEQHAISALWILSPSVDGYMFAAFRHGLDPSCGRWLHFPWYSPSADTYSLYADVNGPCSSVFSNLEEIGRNLSATPVALDRAGNCSSGAVTLYQTTAACSAPDRLGAGTGAPLALMADMEAVRRSPMFSVKGCGAKDLFLYNTWPVNNADMTFKRDTSVGPAAVEDEGSQACPAYATPSAETDTYSGSFQETYLDAGRLHDALQALRGSRVQGLGAAGVTGDKSSGDLSAGVIGGRWRFEYRWMDLRQRANASYIEALIDEGYQSDMEEIANLGLGAIAKKERASILIALGLLVVATLQLPLAYDRNVRSTIVSFAARFGPKKHSRAFRLAAVFLSCIVALSAPIAAAMVSLVLATRVSEQEAYLPGYPQISYINTGNSGKKAGEQARDDGAGLVTVEVITSAQKPHVLGLAVVCALCSAAVIAGACFGTWNQHKEDRASGADVADDGNNNDSEDCKDYGDGRAKAARAWVATIGGRKEAPAGSRFSDDLNI